LTRLCSVDRFWRPEVSRHERDLYRDLPDLLVDDERAVARVETVLLELLPELEKTLTVDVDAARRTARIVLTDEQEHRDLHVVDVLELGETGLADDRVAPELSVSARAPVIHEHDREPVVDPRLVPRGEFVAVVRLGAAVDDEDRRVRPAALRFRHEDVDSVYV